MTDTLGPYPLNSIITGDARELAKAIPDESVDLIFTDPPYIKKYMHLYSWLAMESARILKPGCFLFAYTGVYWKWEVMRMMSEYLDYWFDMVLLHTGNSPVMWNKKIVSRYKSVLVYCRKGESPKPRVMSQSFWMGGGDDKRFHTWGQDESTARYYIDCFSKKDDIVLDPFVGGGTTTAVCKMLQRHYLGFEIVSSTAAIARARTEVQQPFLMPEQPEQLELIGGTNDLPIG